jgi:hypothetical protein
MIWSARITVPIVRVGVPVATTAVLAACSGNQPQAGTNADGRLTAGDTRVYETGSTIGMASDTGESGDAADAAKDGWFKVSRSFYGIGAHYVRAVSGLSVAAPFDMLNPNVLLFDGEGPDAKFAGVSYVVADDVEGSPEATTCGTATRRSASKAMLSPCPKRTPRSG